MMPLEVVIRQPRRKWSYLFANLIATLVILLLFAWFVTLLAPVALRIEIGFWQAYWLLLLVRLVFPRGYTPYLPMGETQKEEKI